MTNRDEMRAEFENVVKACGYYGDLKYGEFGYECSHTNAIWAGFRLAYELKDAQLRLLMGEKQNTDVTPKGILS